MCAPLATTSCDVALAEPFAVPADSRKNVDSFTHYHGPTRGFTNVIFIPVPPPADLTFLAIGGGIFVLMLLFMWGADYSKRRLERISKEAARIEMLKRQINDGLEAAGTLSFGMALVSATEFLRSGKFIPFEELRDSSRLKVEDHITPHVHVTLRHCVCA